MGSSFLFLIIYLYTRVHHDVFVEHVLLFNINAGVDCLFVIEVENGKRDLGAAFDDETGGMQVYYILSSNE